LRGALPDRAVPRAGGRDDGQLINDEADELFQPQLPKAAFAVVKGMGFSGGFPEDILNILVPDYSDGWR